MKKILLATTAVVGFAVFATPAMADGLKLDLSGFYRGYGLYADVDEPVADPRRDFDFRYDSEIHFTGETTLDNGLTIGVHSEMELTEDDDTRVSGSGEASNLDESYVYFSGNWGRVNFGQEDGAQYLLQVAAPSADALIDGLRTRFQGFDTDHGGTLGGVGFIDVDFTMDYDNDMGRNATKLTYFTPKFNGFQGGISFAPEVSDGVEESAGVILPIGSDDDLGDFENLWELAARWDGEINGVGLSVGAGYGHMSTEVDDAALTVGSDDRTQWNIASTATFQAFSFGFSYGEDDHGLGTAAAGDGSDTWVVGLGWDNGPYHLGASYLDKEIEWGSGAGEDFEFEQFTFGGTYAFGPGMTFRGAVAFGEAQDNDLAPAAQSRDFTQVTLGTEVNF